jgi:hypothetical protein
MALRLPYLLALLVATISVARAEPLAIVVPADSRHRLDRAEELSEIYLKKRQFWSNGQRIVPVNLPVADSRRQHFSHSVLGLLPEQLDDYWNERYFHGVLPPEVLNSVEGVLRFVAATPGAIGYVPLCNVDQRVVAILLLDGGEARTAACPPEAQAR